MADLLVRNAALVATCDAGGPRAARRLGGRHGRPGQRRRRGGASRRRRRRGRSTPRGCLVTPGPGQHPPPPLPEPHPRLSRPRSTATLFGWLTPLYPLWAGLDEEAAYLVGVGRAGRAGARRVHHVDGPPLRRTRTAAATCGRPRSPRPAELGLRFHPTRGSMTLSKKDGGLPPDSVVQDDDAMLADCERLVAAHHDPSPGAMVRVALAPCSPFSVTPDADDGDRRAGRAARRPAAHPPRRGPGRGRVLPRALRPPPGRAVRARSAG